MTLDQRQIELTEYIDNISSNGIKQHSKEWYAARVCGFGGSQLSTLMGLNPFKNITSLIREKIGLENFQSTLSTQWGNLFEEVIQKFVELDKKVKIIGEDIFVMDSETVYYSPDGLSVSEVNGAPICTLWEFKCPFSRMPTTKPPKYYVPQVKAGLDIIKMTDVGYLVEAVIRRCLWKDINNGIVYDRGLNQRHKISSSKILAKGFIGVYRVANTPETDIYNQMLDLYQEHCSKDFGDSPKELFTLVTECLCNGDLQAWYGEVHIDQTVTDIELQKYKQYVCDGKHVDFGIIPWKIIDVYYHRIEKEDGFIDQFREQIKKIVDVVKTCNSAGTEEKISICDDYLKSMCHDKFADEQPDVVDTNELYRLHLQKIAAAATDSLTQAPSIISHNSDR